MQVQVQTAVENDTVLDFAKLKRAAEELRTCVHGNDAVYARVVSEKVADIIGTLADDLPKLVTIALQAHAAGMSATKKIARVERLTSVPEKAAVLESAS